MLELNEQPPIDITEEARKILANIYRLQEVYPWSIETFGEQTTAGLACRINLITAGLVGIAIDEGTPDIIHSKIAEIGLLTVCLAGHLKIDLLTSITGLLDHYIATVKAKKDFEEAVAKDIAATKASLPPEARAPLQEA